MTAYYYKVPGLIVNLDLEYINVFVQAREQTEPTAYRLVLKTGINTFFSPYLSTYRDVTDLIVRELATALNERQRTLKEEETRRSKLPPLLNSHGFSISADMVVGLSKISTTTLTPGRSTVIVSIKRNAFDVSEYYINVDDAAAEEAVYSEFLKIWSDWRNAQ